MRYEVSPSFWTYSTTFPVPRCLRLLIAVRSNAPGTHISTAPVAEPPVDLGAEHEDVRHQVEPEEEQHEAAECLQRDEVPARQAHERWEQLEARLEQDRREDRAGEGLLPGQRGVRQQPVERPEEAEDQERRDGERVDVGKDPASHAGA